MPEISRLPALEEMTSRLLRYVLSAGDFSEAASYIGSIKRCRARVTIKGLLTAAVVTYCRPFTQNDTSEVIGLISTVPTKPLRPVLEKYSSLHEKLITIRNKGIAHTSQQWRPYSYRQNERGASAICGLHYDVLSEGIALEEFEVLCTELKRACEVQVHRIDSAIRAKKSSA
jgi:hypothetical protein